MEVCLARLKGGERNRICISGADVVVASRDSRLASEQFNCNLIDGKSLLLRRRRPL